MRDVLTAIPTLHDLPWKHRGNGVITTERGRVIGAFEQARTAEAVVALVNSFQHQDTDNGK